MHTGRHGVPQEVIDAHFKASEEFFALPPEKKMLKVPMLSNMCATCLAPAHACFASCSIVVPCLSSSCVPCQ